jgi:hypothetical protein
MYRLARRLVITSLVLWIPKQISSNVHDGITTSTPSSISIVKHAFGKGCGKASATTRVKETPDFTSGLSLAIYAYQGVI